MEYFFYSIPSLDTHHNREEELRCTLRCTCGYVGKSLDALNKHLLQGGSKCGRVAEDSKKVKAVKSGQRSRKIQQQRSEVSQGTTKRLQDNNNSAICNKNALHSEESTTQVRSFEDFSVMSPATTWRKRKSRLAHSQQTEDEEEVLQYRTCAK